MPDDLFCGSCGELCEAIERRSRFTDDGYGASKTFTAIEIVSDCCKYEHLYRDPELTEELDDLELVA